MVSMLASSAKTSLSSSSNTRMSAMSFLMRSAELNGAKTSGRDSRLGDSTERVLRVTDSTVERILL